MEPKCTIYHWKPTPPRRVIPLVFWLCLYSTARYDREARIKHVWFAKKQEARRGA